MFGLGEEDGRLVAAPCRHVLLLIIGGLIFLPVRLHAAEEEPELLIRQGVALRHQREDARAHGYFKRAYDISHTPRSAAQLGLCEYAIESWIDAEVHLAEALATRDPWIVANRETLESSLATVRQHLGRVDVSGIPPGTKVQVATRLPVPVPSDGVIWVEPGDVPLRFDAPGSEPVLRQLRAVAGEKSILRVQFVPARSAEVAAPAPSAAVVNLRPARPDDGRPPAESSGVPAARGRALGLSTGGAGLVLGIAGALVYSNGAAKLEALRSDATGDRKYNPANGNWQTWEHAGLGLLVGGGALVAAGTIIYLGNRNMPAPDKATPPMAISAHLTAGGAIALIQRNFQ